MHLSQPMKPGSLARMFVCISFLPPKRPLEACIYILMCQYSFCLPMYIHAYTLYYYLLNIFGKFQKVFEAKSGRIEYLFKTPKKLKNFFRYQTFKNTPPTVSPTVAVTEK